MANNGCGVLLERNAEILILVFFIIAISVFPLS